MKTRLAAKKQNKSEARTKAKTKKQEREKFGQGKIEAGNEEIRNKLTARKQGMEESGQGKIKTKQIKDIVKKRGAMMGLHMEELQDMIEAKAEETRTRLTAKEM